MTETLSRPAIYLNPGSDRRIAHGFPWAFSNEIRMRPEIRALSPGVLATLHRVDGKPLGVGSFNAHALIAFRLFSEDPQATIGTDFFAVRLERALRLRQRLLERPYYRLVHAEADGLPGLIADRYGDVIVLQVNTAGMDRLTPEILNAVNRVVQPTAVVLRNDTPMRETEGLVRDVSVVRGSVAEAIPVEEGGLVFFADVIAGQKTGWFYDQRDSRAAIAPLAEGGRVLDVFCYSGGFAISAAARSATSVVGVDSSEAAIELARRAAAANDVADRCTFRRGDAMEELDRLGQQGERFRLVVADPPAFVKSRKDLAAGLKGYRKLARLAATMVEPEGFLFLASCSHNVEPAAFFAEVARGVAASGRSGRVIREGWAAADHPVHLQLPETAYLKSLLLHLD